MRRLLFTLFSLLLIMTNCSSDEPFNEDSSNNSSGLYLKTDQDTIRLEYNDSEAVINIQTNGEWQVYLNPEWLKPINSYNGSGDYSVLFKVSKNETNYERISEVIMQSRKLVKDEVKSSSKKIIIVQGRNPSLLSGDPIAKVTGNLIMKRYYDSSRPLGSESYKNGTETVFLEYKGFNSSSNYLNIRFFAYNLDHNASSSEYVGITVFLQTEKRDLTISEIKQLYLKPYDISIRSGTGTTQNSIFPHAQITSDNLKITESGNIIVYEFINFKSVYDSPRFTITTGKLYFNFKGYN